MITRVFICEDKMSAYLDVIYQNGNSENITHVEIEKLLVSNNVIYGYSAEDIKKAAIKCKIDGGLNNYLIAKGKEKSFPEIQSFSFDEKLVTPENYISKYKHDFNSGKFYEPDEFPNEIYPLVPGQVIGQLLFSAKGNEKINVFGENESCYPDFYPYNIPEFLVKREQILSNANGLLYRDGEKYKILPFQNDFEFSVNIDSAKMAVALEIYPSKIKDVGKSSKNILEDLTSKKIRASVNAPKICGLISSFAKDKKKVSGIISVGKKPVPGRNGEVNVLYNEVPENLISETDDQKIDFKAHNSFVKIEENSVIAVIQDPIPGVEGVDVYGEVVEVKPPKQAKFSSGEGTFINPADNTQLLAKWDGIFQLKNGLPSVRPVLEINGHVDFESGDIDFSGDVIIGGDIKSGFKVKGKSLEISGSVEDCQVSSFGNINISGGFIGEGNGKIVCSSGDLVMGFIHNQTVLCGGNVVIQKECFDAKLKCAGSINCNGDPISIVGGNLCSYLGLNANVIGNETGQKTLIEIGKNFLLEENLDKLSDELEELEKKQRRLKYLFNKLSKWHKKSEYMYLLSKSEKANGILKRTLAEKLIQIKECKENLITKKDVCVKANKIYPGVILNIKGEILIVPKVIENVELKVRNNRVINVK